MFENVDGRTDAGRRSHWYTNSSPRSLRLRCAKKDKRKTLITIDSLMKVERIAECSEHSAIL